MFIIFIAMMMLVCWEQDGCLNWLSVTSFAVAGGDPNDEHDSWWGNSEAFHHPSQWTQHGFIHESCPWTLPQGNIPYEIYLRKGRRSFCEIRVQVKHGYSYPCVLLCVQHIRFLLSHNVIKWKEKHYVLMKRQCSVMQIFWPETEYL